MDRPRIKQAVADMLRSAPKKIHLERIPSGRFNDSFFVDAGEGFSLVLRIAPPKDAGFLFYERDMMLGEPETHRIVSAKTAIPIPSIVATDFEGKALGRAALLMERLPGMPLSRWTGPMGPVFKQVGTYLKSLHERKGPAFGYAGPHRPMEPQSTWRAAFEIMWTRMIEDIRSCGGYTQEEASDLLSLFQKHRHVFERDIAPSLLHMDIWHENILVDGEGAVSGIIDWDRALWGDPEIEFAVLDYCGVTTKEFCKGYEYSPVRDSGSAIRAVFYFLYEVQKYIVIERLRRKNMQASHAYRTMALRLAQRIM